MMTSKEWSENIKLFYFTDSPGFNSGFYFKGVYIYYYYY